MIDRTAARLLLAGLLALTPLLLSSPATAQPDVRDPVRKLEYDANYVARRMLASDDVIEVAWGANVAASHGLTDRISDLRRKLRAIARDHAREIGATLVLLDALIRLDAAVPREEVMPLFDRYPDEVIVLLSRTPHASREALLEVLERQNQTVHWMAAGSLLAKVKSAAFADYLVRRMFVTLSVTVADKQTNSTVGIGGGSGGLSGGRRSYRRGLPPVPHYRLETAPKRGHTVLCAGPTPVYYRRFTSSLWPGQRRSRRDTRYYACRYLAHMVGVSYSQLGFNHMRDEVVVWKGPEDLTAHVEALRQKGLDGWQKMIEQLVAAKLLDPAAAAKLQPRVEVVFHDQRADKSVALPRSDV